MRSWGRGDVLLFVQLCNGHFVYSNLLFLHIVLQWRTSGFVFCFCTKGGDVFSRSTYVGLTVPRVNVSVNYLVF